MSLERQEFRERPADHPLGGNRERAGSLVNYEPSVKTKLIVVRAAEGRWKSSL